MKKFEYKILNIDSAQFDNTNFQKNLDIKFNTWGEEGWELIEMKPYIENRAFQSNSANFIIIFKREKFE